MLIRNFFGHLATVCRHRHKVLIHCAKAGILKRGLLHDLSKFSPAEFIPGVKYYQGTRSPNEMEREQNGYSSAWLHHKGRNRHHFEYWVDYNPKTKRAEPVKMPDIFIYEMFCDRVSASKIYKKDAYTNDAPLEYFRRGSANRAIEKQTSQKLEMLLVMLAEKGEEAVFSYIKAQPK
ncbi:MAG: catalase [Ruminococcus sp.]|nr:catalase [Ruminococcus sp.]